MYHKIKSPTLIQVYTQLNKLWIEMGGCQFEVKDHATVEGDLIFDLYLIKLTHMMERSRAINES